MFDVLWLHSSSLQICSQKKKLLCSAKRGEHQRGANPSLCRVKKISNFRMPVDG